LLTHSVGQKKSASQFHQQLIKILNFKLNLAHFLTNLFASLHTLCAKKLGTNDDENDNLYRVFRRFRQAKITDGGLFLDSSQLSMLYEPPQKMTFDLKVVKIDLKIIISLF